jgi:hypothetical protein
MRIAISRIAISCIAIPCIAIPGEAAAAGLLPVASRRLPARSPRRTRGDEPRPAGLNDEQPNNERLTPL